MNAQPLGQSRRWGGGGSGEYRDRGGYDRERDRNAPKRPYDYGAPRGGGEMPMSDGARKRRSRWGSESDRKDVSSAAISGNVSGQELDRYAIQVRLDEINRKLRTGDVIPPERERSPSPPPTYDSQGFRNNTREIRYRKKLEEERTQLVDRQMRLDPSYRPPQEYQGARRSGRPTEKVYLPVREFPEINFFGLLVGPRGNTLKKMESQSGAKIHIRGRGSVKHGKGSTEGEEEDMHCIVTADNERSIKHCIKLINEVVATAASTPETQNDHKRSQLRELAVLNGTLRDDENQICQNCGEKGHRKYECPQDRNWTTHIVCHKCGQSGHLARDCFSQRPYGSGTAAATIGAGGGSHVESEYATLMAELGERPGGHVQGGYLGVPGYAGPPTNEKGEKIPPWRDPAVWNASNGSRSNRDFMQDSVYAEQNWDATAANGYDAYAGYAATGEATEVATDGQRDYSAEWAAYYAAQAAAAQQQGEGDGAPARDYSKEWEEYYRQQALAQQQQAAAAGDNTEAAAS